MWWVGRELMNRIRDRGKLKNTFELPLVLGDYSIGGCVRNSTFFDVRYFSSLVYFSFHWGQTGEQHLEQQQHQVTSNMNTQEYRIAEVVQIYPHQYDRSQRDFKDSENKNPKRN